MSSRLSSRLSSRQPSRPVPSVPPSPSRIRPASASPPSLRSHAPQRLVPEALGKWLAERLIYLRSAHPPSPAAPLCWSAWGLTPGSIYIQGIVCPSTIYTRYRVSFSCQVAALSPRRCLQVGTLPSPRCPQVGTLPSPLRRRDKAVVVSILVLQLSTGPLPPPLLLVLTPEEKAVGTGVHGTSPPQLAGRAKAHGTHSPLLRVCSSMPLRPVAVDAQCLVLAHAPHRLVVSRTAHPPYVVAGLRFPESPWAQPADLIRPQDHRHAGRVRTSGGLLSASDLEQECVTCVSCLDLCQLHHHVGASPLTAARKGGGSPSGER